MKIKVYKIHKISLSFRSDLESHIVDESKSGLIYYVDINPNTDGAEVGVTYLYDESPDSDAIPTKNNRFAYEF